MKKILAFLLVFTLLLACCGCSTGSTDNSQPQSIPTEPAVNQEHERMVRVFLSSLFTSDVEAVEACVPDDLKPYYRLIVSASNYDNVSFVDVQAEFEGQLDEQAIQDIQTRYLEETGMKITISNAYLYGWKVTMHYAETEETKTANSDQFGVIVAEIHGRLYTLSTL